MDLLDLVILVCMIYSLFTIGSILNDIENEKIINEFQIELNESIKIQNQMKIDYEYKMFEIAIDNVLAREYALDYMKTKLFFELDDNGESKTFFCLGNELIKIQESNRFNFTSIEMFGI